MRPNSVFTLAAIVFALSGLVSLLAATPASAQTSTPVRLGVLTCQVDGGVGRILGSKRELSCIFEKVGGDEVERYAGEITRIGLDIGTTNYSDIAWGVFSLAQPYAPGALQGTYAGLSGSVSVGVGLGANVMVGGLERSFALQPLSVEASRGLNLAVGVASLRLISVGGFSQ